MKLRKILSALCAAAVLTAALPTVSAAESRTLSDAAGETVVVHVTHIKADGRSSQTSVNVNIPENATSQEEHELIQSAALAAVDPISPLSVSENFDWLYQGARVHLNSEYKDVTTIFLKHDYDRLVFEFNGGAYTGDPTVAFLRLTDASGHIFTSTGPLEYQYPDLRTAEVIIWDGEVFSGTSISFPNGSYFEVAAKINRGESTFAGFMIKGYY
ncbi:MAG: hypothetical protein HFF06_06775 [Oscillospiraceae bacterium]|jgi:hypothetical protein|nr:hypothetical protein [Oscillospiraceae bacterium]